MTNTRFRLPPLTPIAAIIEIGLLIFVALFATSEYMNFDPEKRLSGFEMEYTTAVGYTISETFRTEGFIPYWQSYTAFGDPAIDSWLGYTLNPFAMGPSLLFGGINGLKIGIVVAAVVAGVGGWALGRVLGLGWIGRVILGVLCIGKGNMYAMIDVGGYYQFVANQSWFPWIGAGIVSLLWLPHRRWPIVLLAVSMMLLFFSGMVWFMMPTLFVLSILSLAHLFFTKVWKGQQAAQRVPLDFVSMRRLTVAGVLTIGLCMATFLPLWVNRDNAPKQKLMGNEFLDLGIVLDQFTQPSLGAYYGILPPVVRTEVYNFVSPLWYLVLLLVLSIPALVLYRNAPPKLWRVYISAWAIVIFFVLWSAGLNPILLILEQFVPLIGQFRHQWRTLSVASLWLIVIIAIHLNAVWEIFIKSGKWQERLFRTSRIRLAFAAVLLITTGSAAFAVVNNWKTVKAVEPETLAEDMCIAWLRRTYPDRYLSVWSGRYINVTSYLQNRVRHWQIYTDFFPVTPIQATLLQGGNLTQALPEFGVAFGGETPLVESLGFTEPVDRGTNCPQGQITRKVDALSYAFTIPLDVLAGFYQAFPIEVTTPVHAIEHHQDRLALYVDSDPKQALVVTVQEAAYPGWMVEVNGKAAKLESVGGQIGVVIPAGTGRNHVYFQYTAPLFMAGSWITLLFCVLTGLFTLRAERLVPKSLIVWLQPRLQTVKAQTRAYMFNPEAFAPKEAPPVAPVPLLPDVIEIAPIIQSEQVIDAVQVVDDGDAEIVP